MQEERTQGDQNQRLGITFKDGGIGPMRTKEMRWRWRGNKREIKGLNDKCNYSKLYRKPITGFFGGLGGGVSSPNQVTDK